MKTHRLNKQDIYSIVWIGIMILMVILVVAFVILRTWVFFTYGDTPVTELPAWVWWLMQDGGNK